MDDTTDPNEIGAYGPVLLGEPYSQPMTPLIQDHWGPIMMSLHDGQGKWGRTVLTEDQLRKMIDAGLAILLKRAGIPPR